MPRLEEKSGFAEDHRTGNPVHLHQSLGVPNWDREPVIVTTTPECAHGILYALAPSSRTFCSDGNVLSLHCPIR